MLVFSILMNLITLVFAIVTLKSYKNIKKRNHILEIQLKYRQEIIKLLKKTEVI